MLLGLSIQSEVGGYICNDQVVWFSKALTIAENASNLLKPFNSRRKYPALLDDTHIFGVEHGPLFVVPFRLYGTMHSAGYTGRDRVVIDTLGNFKGVVIDGNDGNSILPAYKACRPFLINNPSPELHVDDGYKMTGFACASNFVSADIIPEIQSRCIKYLEIIRDGKKRYFPRREFIKTDKGFWFTHIGKIDYEAKHPKNHALYYVEFDSKCIFLRTRRYYRRPSNEDPCAETWTQKPLSPANMAESLSDFGSKNLQGIEQLYTCRKFIFKISSIRNYINYVYSLFSNNSPHITEGNLISQGNGLSLWPMVLPERRGPTRTNPHVFALGFDHKLNFSGIYYSDAKGYVGKKFLLCPGFHLLLSHLEDSMEYYRNI